MAFHLNLSIVDPEAAAAVREQFQTIAATSARSFNHDQVTAFSDPADTSLTIASRNEALLASLKSHFEQHRYTTKDTFVVDRPGIIVADAINEEAVQVFKDGLNKACAETKRLPPHAPRGRY